MAKSKRNILNKKTGFNIMVNLYIIRYLYSHLDKANCFMEVGAKRKKSINFYKNVVMISGRRINSIFKGAHFEISKDDTSRLSGMFNINEKYFSKNGLIIEVHLLEETDWKCFFYEQYYTDFELNLPDRVVKEKSEKVIKTLKQLSKKDNISTEYDTSNSLYRIYYYFKTGVVYQEETRLTKFLKSLSNLKLSDWEDIEDDLENLERYQKVLNKHLNYVNKVVDYKHMKAEINQ